MCVEVDGGVSGPRSVLETALAVLVLYTGARPSGFRMNTLVAILNLLALM